MGLFLHQKCSRIFISNVGQAALAQGKIAAIDTGRAKVPITAGHPPQFIDPTERRAYFPKYKWNGEKGVAIGNATATELQKLEIKDAMTVEEPSERALAKLVLRLLKE